jgi:quinol monooxygenase YgiN
MAHVFVRHRVNDFETWKKVFDEFADTRKASGEKAFQIYRPGEDSENLHLLFEWDNMDNARKFMESSELKAAMGRAGVAEEPHIQFMGEALRGKP